MQPGAARQRQKADTGRRDILAQLAGRDSKTLCGQFREQLFVDEMHLP